MQEHLNKLSITILEKLNILMDILDSTDNTSIDTKRNTQKRTIKMIVGHLIDSASNNTHRIVNMQYQSSPLIFPDYANLGANDKWISIQNYNNYDWEDLKSLLQTTNKHIAFIIKNIDTTKLNNTWITALEEEYTLEEIIEDYPRHFELHINEIKDLIGK